VIKKYQDEEIYISNMHTSTDRQILPASQEHSSSFGILKGYHMETLQVNAFSDECVGLKKSKYTIHA
jgi:hypothetical protein